MRKLPPLSALRAFEAAARHRSFKRAASELGVTATAVSHQMRSLEAHLGVKLFDRKTRKVVLTSAGEQLLPVLSDGFDAFADAVARVSGVRARPVVTIAATSAFTARWLLPRLARFQARHPEIDLRLEASDAVVDLASGAADIALRYGHGPYPGLHAELLLPDGFVPVVSPALGLRRVEQLFEATLIHFDWRNPGPVDPTWAAWLAAAGLPATTGAGHLRFSEEAHAVEAVLAGQGAALLSAVLVQADVAAGRLLTPFGPRLPAPNYFLVEPRRARPNPDAEAVRAWLRDEACAVGD